MRLFYWNAYGNNFGDAIGPEIVREMAGRNIGTVDGNKVGRKRYFERNLFALGSIFHMVKNGDVVWGTGVNPRYHNPNKLDSLDIRAVRGPLTRDYLRERYDLDCPEIYGDPALLLPKLFPGFKRNPRRHYGIIPHFIDIEYIASIDEENVILPNQNWKRVISLIVECELVISSSLHGLIVAEAFGVPTRWLHNQELPGNKTEGTFKYNDYYASTSRTLNDFSVSIEAAIKAGGKEPIRDFDCNRLLGAFPHDIFDPPTYYRSLLSAVLEDIIRTLQKWKRHSSFRR
jgi:pyruvyltransferase